MFQPILLGGVLVGGSKSADADTSALDAAITLDLYRRKPVGWDSGYFNKI